MLEEISLGMSDASDCYVNFHILNILASPAISTGQVYLEYQMTIQSSNIRKTVHGM